MTQPVPPPRTWRVSDLALSLIRTYTPAAVGAVLTWLAVHFHVVVDERISAEAVVWAVLGLIIGYYSVARWLERRRGHSRAAAAARWVGRWMIGGVISQPVYVRSSGGQVVELSGDGSMRRIR